jgi:programmed cell death protein 5
MKEQQAKFLQMQKINEEIVQLETFVKKFISPEAVQRYGALKEVHQEKALRSIMIVAELVKEGKLRQTVSDRQYKALLIEITPQRKEFKVKRK